MIEVWYGNPDKKGKRAAQRTKATYFYKGSGETKVEDEIWGPDGKAASVHTTVTGPAGLISDTITRRYRKNGMEYRDITETTVDPDTGEKKTTKRTQYVDDGKWKDVSFTAPQSAEISAPQPGAESVLLGFQGGLRGVLDSNGDIVGEDVFFGPANILIDRRRLDSDGLQGQAGLSLTFFLNEPAAAGETRGFIRTGVMVAFGDNDASFANVSGVPQGTGRASVSSSFVLPVYGGAAIPAPGTPEHPTWIDVYGGVQVVRSEAEISLTELGAPGGAQTFASSRSIHVNPAVGAGVRHYVGNTTRGNPICIQGGVTVSHQDRVSVTARSANFPSETYRVSVDPGLTVDATVGASVGF